MDRRNFLLGCTAAGLVPGCAWARAFSRAPARAVLLLPLTGERAALGSLLHATALAAADSVNRAGLGGRRAIELRVEDWRSDPRRFDALIRQLGSGEGRAAALIGPCPSQSRAETAAWLVANDAVLWDPMPHSGGICGDGILSLGSTPYQSLSQSLGFMAAEVGRRFLLVPGDSGYGRELGEVARWAIGRMDAELLGVAGAHERRHWLARLRRERADVVVCTLEGAELADFLHAYAEARLDPRETPILAPTMTELDVALAGGAVAEGHVACQPYFAAMATLGNDRFLAALRRRLAPGQVPTAQAEAMWGLLHLFARAVGALDDLDPHPILVREAARGQDVLLPQGRVRLDPATLHPYLWPKLAVVTADGGFKVIARSDRPVAPLPFWGRAACPATPEMVDARLEWSE
ncbi:MAG: transporter substrate-binding protein [Bacteroidales bacterium]